MARARRGALLVTGVLAVLAWLAAPAAAHTELATTEPAADAVVTVPLTQLRLTFTGPLQAGGDHALGLFGPGGERIGESAPALDGDRAIQLALPPDVGGGVMTVRYLVIAADGHALDGEYAFTYEPPAPPPSPSPSPEPSEEPAAPAAPEESVPPAAVAAPSPVQATGDEPPGRGSTPVLVAIGGVTAVLAGGAVALIAYRNRPGGPNDPANG